MQVIGGDITAALCLIFVCIFESCIYCGLIQTNTGYEELFEVCTMGAQITDRNYCVRYTSFSETAGTYKPLKQMQPPRRQLPTTAQYNIPTHSGSLYPSIPLLPQKKTGKQ